MNRADDPQSARPSWLLRLVVVATVLAGSILLLAIVLGVRAGQEQLSIQARQQAGIYLQQALDLRAEGQLEAALAQYQQVLALDPDNSAAMQGIEYLLQLASGVEPKFLAEVADGGNGAPAPATEPSAGAPPETVVNASDASSTPPSESDSAHSSALQEAETAYARGDWLTAARVLETMQSETPEIETERVAEVLFNTYVNLAAARDQSDSLEEALAYVDKALALRPESTALQQARSTAAAYLDVLTVYGADWGRTVELLQALYNQSPTYRDVEDRLQEAYVAYGDRLAQEEEWCLAEEKYIAAIDLFVSDGLFFKRDTVRERCGVNVVADTTEPEPGNAITAAPASSDELAAATESAESSSTADAEPEISDAPSAPTTGPTGRIIYSAANPIDGTDRIIIQPAAGGPVQFLVEGGRQPAVRADGARLTYTSSRDDSQGLSALDPETGLVLRFTNYAEDREPTWSPEGNRIAFASNREGDRRWRIYVAWAEVDGGVTNLGFGQSPAWHPAADLIAFQGCDPSGNGCGLRMMNSGGGAVASLTSEPSDTTPAWSPDGQYVVFTSNGRSSNFDIYRASTADRAVLQLTDSPAVDGNPAVSPDGNWVVFFSNRGGAWALYATPLAGGAAVEIAAVEGVVDDWLGQNIQWLN